MTTDRCEIERLYKTHYAQMYRLAMMILHDDSLARDVVQDVFASVLQNTGQTVGPGYLMSSVRNRCVNHVRDTGVRERLARLYMLDGQEYDDEDWPDEATVEAVNSIVGTALAPQCRRVVAMRFHEGLKYAEIASRLGISEVAVYKHLRHAIETIRKTLNNG